MTVTVGVYAVSPVCELVGQVMNDQNLSYSSYVCYRIPACAVKFVKMGKPTLTNYHNCPKMEQFGFTTHKCIRMMHLEWQTV